MLTYLICDKFFLHILWFHIQPQFVYWNKKLTLELAFKENQSADWCCEAISVHCMSVIYVYLWVSLSCAVYCCVLCCYRALCVWSLIFSADCVHSLCEIVSVDRAGLVLFDLIALTCHSVCVGDADCQTDTRHLLTVNCDSCFHQVPAPTANCSGCQLHVRNWTKSLVKKPSVILLCKLCLNSSSKQHSYHAMLCHKKVLISPLLSNI